MCNNGGRNGINSVHFIVVIIPVIVLGTSLHMPAHRGMEGGREGSEMCGIF